MRSCCCRNEDPANNHCLCLSMLDVHCNVWSRLMSLIWEASPIRCTHNSRGSSSRQQGGRKELPSHEDSEDRGMWLCRGLSHVAKSTGCKAPAAKKLT